MEYYFDGVLTLRVYFENFACVSIMYMYTPACRSTRWRGGQNWNKSSSKRERIPYSIADLT